MLHITNGDSTACSIEQTDLPGTVLPWQDVLHEGPTPAGLSFDQMSKLRARFIADHGWGSYEDILADFLRRDSALEQFQTHKEVVLWFEHDLYDQLQLIQLLHWFSHHGLGRTTLSLICIGEFPGLDNFKGLGELSPAQLRPLYDTRTAITPEQLALGSAAWQAYCAPEPTAIEAFLSRDTSALPFLRAALLRHLEQFPAVESGLSRTEQQILEAVAAGSQKPAEIFLTEQEKEASAFMGDSWLWDYIAALCDTHDPLLRRADGGPFTLPSEQDHPEEFFAQTLELTERGRAVLAGQADRIRDGIDRWRGGVHLHGPDAAWRWDRQQRQIVRWASHKDVIFI
ncbi:MAG TPA: hypothetical protein VGJ87_20360 [Roseiflexaceae bacterium]|jgi:hypothetical protein